MFWKTGSSDFPKHKGTSPVTRSKFWTFPSVFWLFHHSTGICQASATVTSWSHWAHDSTWSSLSQTETITTISQTIVINHYVELTFKIRQMIRSIARFHCDIRASCCVDDDDVPQITKLWLRRAIHNRTRRLRTTNRWIPITNDECSYSVVMQHLRVAQSRRPHTQFVPQTLAPAGLHCLALHWLCNTCHCTAVTAATTSICIDCGRGAQRTLTPTASHSHLTE